MEDQERASQHDVYSHPSPVEHWRHVVEIAALTIAALWGFYVFVYQERIKPAYEPPAVEVAQNVRHEAMRGGKEFVWVDMPFKNIGSVDLQFLGVIINAYGVRYSDQDRTVVRRSDAATTISHTLPAGKPVLLASRLNRYVQLGGQRRFIEDPGEVRTDPLYFALASGKYDAVRIDFMYCFTRVDNRTLYPFKPSFTSDGAFDTLSFATALAHRPGVTCHGASGYYFTL